MHYTYIFRGTETGLKHPLRVINNSI